jgi:hypothetical protein
MFVFLTCSVSDPVCLSRILIFIFPRPGSNNSNKRGRGKKLVVVHFYCSQKFHRIENYLILEQVRYLKKICANL